MKAWYGDVNLWWLASNLLSPCLSSWHVQPYIYIIFLKIYFVLFVCVWAHAHTRARVCMYSMCIWVPLEDQVDIGAREILFLSCTLLVLGSKLRLSAEAVYALNQIHLLSLPIFI